MTQAAAASFFDWQPEALYERLQPLCRGPWAHLGLASVQVEAVAETGSTNTDLLNQARRGDLSAVVRVATRQTAGRGRRGKRWASAQAEPCASLAFSVGLPIDLTEQGGARWSGLSLAVGLALAEALSPPPTAAQHDVVQVKWPNDLWWQGRKLAGILIESMPGYAVVGVGLNVAPLPNAELGDAAALSSGFACMAELRASGDGPALTSADLAVGSFHQAAAAVLQAAADMRAEGFEAAFAERFAARDALRGHTVNVSGPPSWQGVACGVDGSGALLVHTADGMITVTSSEVSVRPSNAPAWP